jgi:hypothetical protein
MDKNPRETSLITSTVDLRAATKKALLEELSTIVEVVVLLGESRDAYGATALLRYSRREKGFMTDLGRLSAHLICRLRNILNLSNQCA